MDWFNIIKNNPIFYSIFTFVVGGGGGLIVNYFKERKFEKYKKGLEEQSEVFRRKLDIYQSFIKEEYLTSGYILDENQKKSLKYYGDIGLVGDNKTLQSIVISKLSNDQDFDDIEIERVSNVIIAMRKEFDKNLNKDDKKIIFDYCKLLVQIGNNNTNNKSIITVTTNKTDTFTELNKSDFKFIRLGDILSLKSGYYISNSYIIDGGDILYIRIKNIDSIDSIKEEYITVNSGYENKIVNANNLFLISTVGTIGKTLYLNNGKKILISSSLVYGLLDKEEINGKFLAFIFKSSYVINQMEFLKKGVAQPFVSISGLKNILIPMPKLELQNKIINGDLDKKIIELNSIL